MKVVISGPRRLPSRDNAAEPWPHMHIALDLPEVPDEGERITLNGGSTYVVKRRYWYVEGPENPAYFGYNSDYDTNEGVFDVVYLDVLPSDYDEPFTYAQAIAEGTERGRELASAEVERLLALAAAPGVDPASAMAMLREWAKDGAARAREREALVMRHREFAGQILADLQRKREEIQGNSAQ